MMSPFLSATQQFSYVTDHQKNTRDYLFSWPLEFYNRDKRRGGGRLSSKPPPSFENPGQRSMENFRKRKKQCPDEEGFLVAQLNPFVPAGEGSLVHGIKVVPIKTTMSWRTIRCCDSRSYFLVPKGDKEKWLVRIHGRDSPLNATSLFKFPFPLSLFDEITDFCKLFSWRNSRFQ